jgi:hypothetical protein
MGGVGSPAAVGVHGQPRAQRQSQQGSHSRSRCNSGCGEIHNPRVHADRGRAGGRGGGVATYDCDVRQLAALYGVGLRAVITPGKPSSASPLQTHKVSRGAAVADSTSTPAGPPGGTGPHFTPSAHWCATKRIGQRTKPYLYELEALLNGVRVNGVDGHALGQPQVHVCGGVVVHVEPAHRHTNATQARACGDGGVASRRRACGAVHCTRGRREPADSQSRCGTYHTSSGQPWAIRPSFSYLSLPLAGTGARAGWATPRSTKRNHTRKRMRVVGGGG